ncbi:cytochrome-c oxidase, cbb3-type subunit III [Ideonella paludis]|uniref:Cbb3-type cytochrome c oxidase subunit n=1 Tax=Ideonella paludis TaxID=1233411 RepID=A0ABS5DUG5_9BURK|nr:cytochrome-c oxidase, cbb3-type subunit III [Ideonella paludis]MBQ0934790.1 cytochrome-c oxidase, cbb3-type subunit III [Ideonella paludis]
MSDFFSNGWSLYVAGIVIGGLLFCLAMLIIASKRTVMANDNTTGHVWDEDLKEMNNPLPRWWMGLFVITVVFAGVYLAIYPGLGSNAGTLKWSAVGQLEAEQAKARQAMESVYAEFANKTPEQLGKDAKAMAIGERLFVNNCAQCHGADARGSKSFPNLADADWLGGSGAEYIHKTIAEGRTGVMPPMGAAVGSADDVKNVANYVLSLSNSPHNSVAAQLGKAKFGACAACHGATGAGNPALGAPNLTDKVWLHGWGEAAIIKMINEGKTNVMPAQGARFTPEQMKVLTAYVLNLSQRTAPAAQ